MAFLAAPVWAELPETAQQGGDFTFRRVGVPDASETGRITVQIDPDQNLFRITPEGTARRPGDPRPETALAVPALPGGLVPAEPTGYEWYWEAVPPGLGQNPASRYLTAMETLQKNALKIGTPRLETLQRIVDAHGKDILRETIGKNVSPALVVAVIAIESAGRVDAVSHAGAEGLMQLIPATAARFGVTDSTNPSQNIKGGVAYLDWLLKEFDGDSVLALAGYNAGEGAVAEHNGVPPYAETRAYVPKVLAAFNVARGLCLTPPTLPGDGCVFIDRQAASGG